MEYINVIAPVHKFDDTVKGFLAKAIGSYDEASRFLAGQTDELGTKLTIVCPERIIPEISSFLNEAEWSSKCAVVCNNTGKTDFCSQINFAVENTKDKYFSILEYDDEYCKKWFWQFSQYQLGNEDVSIFLPVNVVYDSKDDKYWQYGNEMPLATSFSNKLGYIDFDCLQNFSAFNITGGIIRTEDFKSAGMLKPSIKVSFTYELFLRHAFNVDGSLTKEYEETIPMEDIDKWFDLAKRECSYKNDREKDISKAKKTSKLK